ATMTGRNTASTASRLTDPPDRAADPTVAHAGPPRQPSAPVLRRHDTSVEAPATAGAETKVPGRPVRGHCRWNRPALAPPAPERGPSKTHAPHAARPTPDRAAGPPSAARPDA